MDLALCIGALLSWNRKGPIPNCCHKVAGTESARMSLYAVALRAPDHYSSSIKLYSWHYAFRQVEFSWHLPNPDLSVGLPDGEELFIIPENAFPLLQSPMAASFTPHHSDRMLVCGCSAMETHFTKLPKNSGTALNSEKYFESLSCTVCIKHSISSWYSVADGMHQWN